MSTQSCTINSTHKYAQRNRHDVFYKILYTSHKPKHFNTEVHQHSSKLTQHISLKFKCVQSCSGKIFELQKKFGLFPRNVRKLNMVYTQNRGGGGFTGDRGDFFRASIWNKRIHPNEFGQLQISNKRIRIHNWTPLLAPPSLPSTTTTHTHTPLTFLNNL